MNIEFAKKEIPLGAIFSLVELSAKDVVAARDRMAKADGQLEIIDHQFDGIFDLYTVLSKLATYEVVRLGYFVKCNCKSSEFTHGACKHVGLVLPAKCSVCFEREVEVKGKCRDCHQLTTGFLNRPVPKAPAFVSTGTLWETHLTLNATYLLRLNAKLQGSFELGASRYSKPWRWQNNRSDGNGRLRATTGSFSRLYLT